MELAIIILSLVWYLAELALLAGLACRLLEVHSVFDRLLPGFGAWEYAGVITACIFVDLVVRALTKKKPVEFKSPWTR